MGREKKQEILKAIRDFIREYGYPPTIREIARMVGLKSTKGVKVHIDNLVKEGLLKKTQSKARGLMVEPVRLPIVGRVAAGLPNLAFEEIEGYFDPFSWQDCFLLRVKGDSMINARIYDGDLVVVRPGGDAQEGDIVVANVEGETTIKRLRVINGRFVLKPENDSYP
ncbi:MAG: transcriptional repressor LexA, partial [candidate division WOR-3 bacterium]